MLSQLVLMMQCKLSKCCLSTPRNEEARSLMVGEAHVHHTHGAPFFRTYSCCDQGCNPSRSSSCLNFLICHSSHSAALPQNAIRHCRLEQRQTFYLCS